MSDVGDTVELLPMVAKGAGNTTSGASVGDTVLVTPDKYAVTCSAAATGDTVTIRQTLSGKEVAFAGGGLSDSPLPFRTKFAIVCPPDGSILILGGMIGGALTREIWRSTDSGKRWTCITSTPEWAARCNIYATAKADGTIVICGGNNGGNGYSDVWTSSDGGVHWTQKTIAAEWALSQWVGRSGYLGALTELTDGSLLLVGGYDYRGTGTVNNSWRSTDGGVHWTQISASAPWPVMKSVPLALHGDTLTALDFANTKVWTSSNQGASWTGVAATFPPDIGGGLQAMLYPAFSIGVLSDNTLVVLGYLDWEWYYSDSCWSSTDGGINWIEKIASSGAYAGEGITDMCALATPSGGAIVSIFGVSRDDLFTPHSRIYRSTNGGQKWTRTQ